MSNEIVTIRSVAVMLFASLLPAYKAGTLSARGLRKDITETLQERFDISVHAAAAHYNYAKREAVLAGKVEDFGRSAKAGTLAKVLAEQETPELEVDKWAIINKETREVVGYAPSKNKAYENKTSEQVVKKTADLA